MSYDVELMFVVEVEMEIMIFVLVKCEELVLKGFVVLMVVFVVVLKEEIVKKVDDVFLLFV